MLRKNANDGTCRVPVDGGTLSDSLPNSLVAQKAEIESIKVRHSGNHKDTIIR